jgi:hypothetical protein
MTRLLTALLALSFAAGLGSAASAKQCRDATGKFTKCPSAMASPAPKKCRDAKGKFMKCSSSMGSMGSMKGSSMKMSSPAPAATK